MDNLSKPTFLEKSMGYFFFFLKEDVKIIEQSFIKTLYICHYEFRQRYCKKDC
jgi:hypothetical protein